MAAVCPVWISKKVGQVESTPHGSQLLKKYTNLLQQSQHPKPLIWAVGPLGIEYHTIKPAI